MAHAMPRGLPRLVRPLLRIGIIDLGTNSVRFDVHEYSPKTGKTSCIHREKLMVRLGQGVFLTGLLDEKAKERTTEAFRSFQRKSKTLNVDKIVAFGTSALREAKDASVFLKELKRKTQIEVKIISGEEEARLIAKGIIGQNRRAKTNTRGKSILIDIGGGSTEFSLLERNILQESVSFETGTARLQQIFLKRIPPTPERVNQLRTHLRSVFENQTSAKPLLSKLGRKKHNTVALGSSGTVRALAKLINVKKPKPSFRLTDLKKLTRKLIPLTLPELLAFPGMEARRTDMIVAGAILLEEVMDYFRISKIAFVETSLRDGILYEELALHQPTTLHSSPSLTADDILKKAKLLRKNEHSTKQELALSGEIFDRLAKVHRLDRRWKSFLQVAAVFKNLGELISPIQALQHSAYLIRHIDFASLEPMEREFIAQLCLGLETPKPKLGRLKGIIEVKQHATYLKLLALLQLYNALHSTASHQPILRQIRVNRKTILLSIEVKTSSGLEFLRVEQIADFFKKVFGRSLALRIRLSH